MGSVLWVNQLTSTGEVITDDSDKWALFKSCDALDVLAKKAYVKPFTGLFDHTDLEYNLSDEDLPDDIESTTELMAKSGVWVSADQALNILDGLLAYIQANSEVIKNQEAVLTELTESIAFVNQALEKGNKFNFSVIM